MTFFQQLKLALARLLLKDTPYPIELKPNRIYVVEVPGHPSLETLEAMDERLQQRFKSDNIQFLILSDGIKIAR